jgi:c-di-GMP-binding flagellar brake protein YcgR
MQERRAAKRVRANINVRWETLKTQGRGAVFDLSSSGCFVLAGGEVTPRELARMELALTDQVAIFWGNVVYTISEMGFAVRFVFASEADKESLERMIEKAS